MKCLVCVSIYRLWEGGDKGMSFKAPHGEKHILWNLTLIWTKICERKALECIVPPLHPSLPLSKCSYFCFVVFFFLNSPNSKLHRFSEFKIYPEKKLR